MNRKARIAMLDSHVHFYDASRSDGIVWPPVDSPCYGTRLPIDYPTASPSTACIAVETSQRTVDDDWLVGLSNRSAKVVGIVLNLLPNQPDFESRLERAADCSKFVGVRLRPVREIDWSNARLLANLRRVEQLEKTIEFGAIDESLKLKFAELADRFDGTTWILDHAGHPSDQGIRDGRWIDAMRSIAERPNVVTKITKLVEQPDRRAEIVSLLLDLFGARRLLYGSNWPLCSASELSAEQQTLYRRLFGSDSGAFFRGNGQSAYGVNLSGMP